MIALAFVKITLVAATGIVIGLGSGRFLFGRKDLRYQEGLRRYQRLRSSEMAVGKQFPHVDLLDSRTTDRVRFLEARAVFRVALYVEPACSSCIEAARALYRATLRDSATREMVCIIAGSTDGLDSFVHAIDAEGIDLRLFVDTNEQLRRDYSLSIYPLFISVDSLGVIQQIEPTGYEEEEYLKLLAAVLQ